MTVFPCPNCKTTNINHESCPTCGYNPNVVTFEVKPLGATAGFNPDSNVERWTVESIREFQKKLPLHLRHQHVDVLLRELDATKERWREAVDKALAYRAEIENERKISDGCRADASRNAELSIKYGNELIRLKNSASNVADAICAELWGEPDRKRHGEAADVERLILQWLEGA